MKTLKEALFSRRNLKIITPEEIVDYIYYQGCVYVVHPSKAFLENICDLLRRNEEGKKFYWNEDKYIVYYNNDDFYRIYNKAKFYLDKYSRKNAPLMIISRLNEQDEEVCYFYIYKKSE